MTDATRSDPRRRDADQGGGGRTGGKRAQAERTGKAAAGSLREAADSEPVKIGARIGLGAYGVTHLLVAWLALQVAFGGGNKRTDQNGAFQTIAAQPFGRVLLWVLAVGFAAVAVWRLSQAIVGASREEDTKKQVMKRVQHGGTAAIFIGLTVLAVRTAVGGGSGGGGQKAAAGVLGWPGGALLVGAVGLGILVAAVMKAKNGWQKKFLEEMDLPSDQHVRQTAERLGQVGTIAKAVSLGLIGVLVMVAAVTFDPAKANGLDPALKALAGEPYGVILLIAMALGLAAYGVFCFFDARYHRV